MPGQLSGLRAEPCLRVSCTLERECDLTGLKRGARLVEVDAMTRLLDGLHVRAGSIGEGSPDLLHLLGSLRSDVIEFAQPVLHRNVHSRAALERMARPP